MHNFTKSYGHVDTVLANTIHHSRLPLTLADPNLPDHPIVFANDAFCELSGYDRAEILGINCRFLQGKETSEDARQAIRDAVKAGTVSTIELINYRKDGTPFVNALQIGPVYDENGKLKFIFGSQMDVTAKRDEELRSKRVYDAEMQHRFLNVVNVLSVLVRLTARENISEAQKFERIDERIRTVGKAHMLTLVDHDNDTLTVRELIEVILNAYAPKGIDSLVLDGPDLTVKGSNLTAVSLFLHELATNAVKHGALGVMDGQVRLKWNVIADADGSNALVFRWQELGGPEVTPPERASGSKMVQDVFRLSKGSLTYDWQPGGLIATGQLKLPRDTNGAASESDTK